VHTCYMVVCYLVWVNIGWAVYLSKNGGRHDFQIDLAIELMIIGIEMDWDGEGEQPDWMRQVDWVPCDCGVCYFCINEHTTGIAHKRRRTSATTVYKCGTRVTNDECSAKRVGLGKGYCYCRMCYRKQDQSLRKEQKKENCKASTMGCKVCQEPICKHCWEEGYDKHA